MPGIQGFPMNNCSPTRGRKRVVKKFTVREGLWTLGVPAVILMGILLLFFFGFLNTDMH
jgi:hypothetical protein